MMTGGFSRPVARRSAIAALVFLLSAADLTALTRTGPIHVDEAWMLNRGFMVGPLYGEYLRTGVAGPGWDSALWQPRKPPLGNVIIATGLWLGRIAPPERPYGYDWRHDYDWNVAHRDDVRLPPAAALRAGRSLIPWFAARSGSGLLGVRRPPLVLGHVLWMTAAWSAGEAVGYLYGPGDAEQHWR